VEVHCHGGREVLRLLLETFAARGLEICSWQEFHRLTSNDPLRAETLIALGEATTTRTAGILLDQYHGALGSALRHILACWEGGDHQEGAQKLQSIVRYTDVGRHLTTPWQLVVAGAPNVGKSSLINALAGYQRCVVAATPGTTRDIVTTPIAIDGWPIELTDTAGLRTATENLEQHGIRRAEHAVSTADLCLWVLDASAMPVWPECPTQTMRYVVNKVDLEPVWDLDKAKDAVRVAALTGRGLAELCDGVSTWLVPQSPAPGAAVPFTPRLAAMIAEAWRSWAAGDTVEAKRMLANIAR
jgi:tRNA modification GTPase